MGPEGAARIGLPYDLELRGKVNVRGYETGVNARVIDSDSVDLMVMPSYSYADVPEDKDDQFDEDFEDSHQIRAFGLPVIARIEASPDFSLFAGPDLRAGTRDREGWRALGVHAGFSFNAGAYASFTPECSVMRVTAGAASAPPSGEYTYGESTLTQGYVTTTCAFGMTVGGRHAPNKR